MEYLNDEIYHFGVPGMKWGVRKQERKDRKMARKANRYIYENEALSEPKKYIDGKMERYKKRRNLLGKEYVKKYEKLKVQSLKLDEKIKRNADKADKFIKQMSNANMVNGVLKTYGIYNPAYGQIGSMTSWKGKKVMTDKQVYKLERSRKHYDSISKIK